MPDLQEDALDYPGISCLACIKDIPETAIILHFHFSVSDIE
uniref:Uncharacterized protein n=1 Tax=Physcomitrium patens TaxID=3218 RepID=A0A2K1KX66_PHYPA|nr:hypothetical protein PHYPA_005377 [Physcomitrium patens]